MLIAKNVQSDAVIDNCEFASFIHFKRPACHENMVKVGGYILGEFGNLIAGDMRSRL